MACWERIAKSIPTSAGGGDGDDEGVGGGAGVSGVVGVVVGGGVGGTGDGAERVARERGQIPSAPHPMCLIRLFASFQCDRTVKDVLREAEGVEGFAEEIDHRRCVPVRRVGEGPGKGGSRSAGGVVLARWWP